MEISSILIVDDSECDHFIIQNVVEGFNSNITIFHAYDGREALDILKAKDISGLLILLDINMPGMNGFEFLEAYQEQAEYAKVAMLSSSEQESDKQKCLSYIFVKHYFVKPLEETDLHTLSQL